MPSGRPKEDPLTRFWKYVQKSDRAGVQNGQAKLTVEKVKTARFAHFKYDIPQRQIAKRYGVTPAAINRAIHGRTWSEV